MRVQAAFDWISDRAERVLASWWGSAAYLCCAGACAYEWGWDGPDRFFTLTGGVILVLLLGASRRSSLAVHAKLDDLEDNDEMIRAEELSEREIEERRK